LGAYLGGQNTRLSCATSLPGRPALSPLHSQGTALRCSNKTSHPLPGLAYKSIPVIAAFEFLIIEKI